MILMICIDDAGGLMFNHRRQSQDRVLRARMLGIAAETKLWVTPYTKKQFEADAPVCVSDTPWLDAGAGDYYFAEDGEMPVERAEQVYLYRWNRAYPGDRHFTADLAALGFVLARSEELAGYSHDCITEEIYERKGEVSHA